MTPPKSHLDFRPFNLRDARFALADAVIEPAKTESRRPYLRAFLLHMIQGGREEDLDRYWERASQRLCSGAHGRMIKAIPAAKFDYHVDQIAWRMWFADSARAEGLGVEAALPWPWAPTCFDGVASEASPVYARYLEENSATQAECLAKEEPSAESTPSVPIQFRWSKEVEAAVLGMVLGGNAVEDLSTWVMGGGLEEVVSRANMAELVRLRHCDSDMREMVVNWAETCQRLFELLPSDSMTTQVTTATRVLIKGVIEDAERTKKEAEQVKAEYQQRLDRLGSDFETFQNQLNAMQGTMEEAVTRIHGTICTSVADALQDQLMAEPEQVAVANSEVQSQIQERQAFEREAQGPIKNLERKGDWLWSQLQVSLRERDEALLQVKSLQQLQTRKKDGDPQNDLSEMFSWFAQQCQSLPVAPIEKTQGRGAVRNLAQLLMYPRAILNIKKLLDESSEMGSRCLVEVMRSGKQSPVLGRECCQRHKGCPRVKVMRVDGKRRLFFYM
ncbi:hypothetical protein CEP54_009261 [Fusarium duplospermum]|uniref:Uncharacterized protein n=1 Tax=Fusarium duplospermum TaxID=1325734 RepID=A0A428PRE9_9HYPO|nr:hypothetical protein CEP54_009261 [Fusarium duplospermum]